MRPVSYISTRPQTISPPDAYPRHYRYTLLCDDELTTICVDVRVTRNADEWAVGRPDAVGSGVAEAVTSRGRSVIDTWVIGWDDPCLDWIVDADDIVGNVQEPEHDRPEAE